ncbi:fatty acyl-AMP ligase [Saccharopolyspora pogona]|uniref:fatty acyl-AMP ligase n=1 Tax=Saccharopolyspora pogona TaxID=333966 RepID=UPI00168206DA|nr:fatty acyl-AMP ligase [Saccharopolyspora pogona]
MHLEVEPDPNPAPSLGAVTILSAFIDLHERDMDRELFVFVDDDGRDAESMTVRRLAQDAQRVMSLLEGEGVRRGDRALLVYLPSLHFISAFLGCLACGVIPVPVAPPNPLKLAQDTGALAAIATSSGARVVLTHDAYQGTIDAALRARPLPPGAPEMPGIPWLATDSRHGGEVDVVEPRHWYNPADPDEPAFLQYTSGSTGFPKGVIVSHRNIGHELQFLAADLGLGDDAVAVTWVPHFHDLGLISFLLNTIAGHSGRTYVMSPLSFLQRPSVWFDVMSRVRATHTSAPNFAYDLMVRKTTPEQRAEWDLSSVRILGSSGEMVLPQTMERFWNAFLPTGVRTAVFHPGYGMAEHTLSLSMGSGGQLWVDKRELEKGRVEPVEADSTKDAAGFYGSGWVTKADANVRIVDPNTGKPCDTGQVGEIWVDSPTKALGYWGLADETRETFRARVSDGDPREYLRTGDLGFFHNGELFVTGRLKELIIVRGDNYYPQDIEESVRRCHPLIRPGGVAAFSVPSAGSGQGERLIVFVETADGEPATDTAREVTQVVRRTVRDSYGIACDKVVVGAPGLVLKTTSGKVRRAACRTQYLQRLEEQPDA